MDRKQVALIPAYEPSAGFGKLVEELWARSFEVVAVDDGSGRRYEGIFEQIRPYAHVLTHGGNRGKGAALKTGLSYIREHYGTDCVIVTADADGQHCLGDICKICRAAARRPGALTLGSREFRPGAPLKSRFGNALTRKVYHAFTGREVRDTQTGLRAFGGELVPELLSVPGERYEYEMNVLLECARRGIPIWEEGIRTVYLDGNASSHFDAVRDSCRIYAELFCFAASRTAQKMLICKREGRRSGNEA